MDVYKAPTIKEQKVDDPEGMMLLYKETGDTTLSNKLVMHYLQFVNIAIYSMRSILLSNIPFDDFFNEGVIALIDCIERYDPHRGDATFDTYSYIGIRGAILKYNRKQNWLPNRLWDARKKINKAKNLLEQELMREPTHTELAEHLNMAEEKLVQYMREMSVLNTVSFEELLGKAYGNALNSALETDGSFTENNILMEELHAALVLELSGLPPKQKQIITLYYYENLNLREIAEILELSQQRISQLRKVALETLKKALDEFM